MSAANRFGMDYRRAAGTLPPLAQPTQQGIIDIHAHINGERASVIWREAARAYGINRVFSMVPLSSAPMVRDRLGDMVRFIAFWTFRAQDRMRAMTSGFLDEIRVFHRDFGARIVKLWNAPRLRELIPAEHYAELVEFDAPWRVKAVEVAQELGMAIMVHVADPDTWFATKYSNAAVYGRKREHYRGLEVMLRRFPGPWIAAHMGGFPEDLEFLDGLLERHENLYIDTSATKWVVRELSKHPRERVRAFFVRWKGRLLFGSDIVSTDEHMAPPPGVSSANRSPMADLADSPEAAFDLYASRYFALRMLFETGYEGESPIADPDLMMTEPGKYNAMSAPLLRGLALPPDVLRELYHDASARLLGKIGAV